MTAPEIRTEADRQCCGVVPFDARVCTERILCPRLLVSVRSVAEAYEAIEGGADILDIKEPTLGSLGMASLESIAAIGSMPQVVQGRVPLSVALGELVDWQKSTAIPAIPAGPRLAKLGLSRSASSPNWIADWLQIRREFQRLCTSPIEWVGVAYADSEEAGSPDVQQVLNAAVETGCTGLLIDTWTKDGRTLSDEIDVDVLSNIAAKCQRAGLFLALAGRLNTDSLRAVSRVPADVIAIRSAACRNHDRVSQIHAERVVSFKRLIQEVFLFDDSRSEP